MAEPRFENTRSSQPHFFGGAARLIAHLRYGMGAVKMDVTLSLRRFLYC